MKSPQWSASNELAIQMNKWATILIKKIKKISLRVLTDFLNSRQQQYLIELMHAHIEQFLQIFILVQVVPQAIWLDRAILGVF